MDFPPTQRDQILHNKQPPRMEIQIVRRKVFNKNMKQPINSWLVFAALVGCIFFSVMPLRFCDAEEQSYGCRGREIYMYDLPEEFNVRILQKCENGLVGWLNICPHAENDGFGRPYDDTRPPLGAGWFRTDSYMLEVIFHTRMKRHPCRTPHPSAAAAIYVPYYAGLDALNYLYNSGGRAAKGEHGKALMEWLRRRPEWRRRQGHDHFVVLGRTAWDFDLSPGGQWGTEMLHLPGVANMTKLFFERRPWLPNEVAIPYPTSFHPSAPRLSEGTEEIRSTLSERVALFTFVGAVRPYAPGNDTFRRLLMRTCAELSRCQLVDCAAVKCSRDARPVVSAFRRAVFCLQPRGDTATRRSTFDAMIAGCVPVFFDRESAYEQYEWHLTEDEGDGYSVYIAQESVVADPSVMERRLRSIPGWRVREMQEKVVRLIPRVVYMTVNGSTPLQVRDALDISVEKVVDKITREREEVEAGDYQEDY